MGMILIMPFPQILQAMTTTMASTAIHQLAAQLLIADWERFRPMAMIIGPVTIGGKNFITLEVPKALISAARIRYRTAEQATPKQA